MGNPIELQVIAPCAERWDGMAGGGDRRFCARCELHVHDLSAMSAGAALDVLAGQAPHLCVRFRTRRDGTVAFRESRVRRALRLVSLVVLSAFFWAAVVIAQRPWLALERRSDEADANVRQRAERARKEIEAKRLHEQRARKLAAIQREMDGWDTLGAISTDERDRIRQEVYEQRHGKAKHRR